MFVSGNNDYNKPGLGLFEAEILLTKLGGKIILQQSDISQTTFQVFLPLKEKIRTNDLSATAV